MLLSAVFGIVSAVVGAGFASGREIMHFFSRYGLISWGLAVLAAALMGGMTMLVMKNGFISEKELGIESLIFLLLLAATGGAMTAAAGELFALTVPLQHARTLGFIITVCAAIFASRRSIQALGMVGKLLVPLMLLAFFFCLRAPVEINENPSFSSPGWGIALIELLGYCGVNITLSSGVIREAGQCYEARKQKKIAVCTAVLVGALLLLGNASMLRHAGSLNHAALPVVMLLRNYGKAGFYLSAAVLYLAVFSTLTAILLAMRSAFPWHVQHPGAWAGLLCTASSLLGFEQIVSLTYPVLGWLGFLLISGKNFFRCGTKRPAASFHGRTANKEENNR